MKHLLLALATIAALWPASSVQAAEPRYRYAYACDGFNQDRDDIAASAMTVALFDKAGLTKRLIHYQFNSNFGGAPTHAEEHRKSALQTAVLFGVIKEENATDDAFFDLSRSPEEKQAAIKHLTAQMRASTPDEPLMMICAGGVQVPYAALKLAIEEGASAEALRSLVFRSHSQANEMAARKNTEHPEYAPNWLSLKELSPTSTFVDHTSPLTNGRRKGGVNASQDSTGWNQAPRAKRKGVEAWQWLKAYGPRVEGFGFTGTKGEWLLTRLKAAGAPELGLNGNAEGDSSDAGNVFGALPGGVTDATMEEIRDYFLGKSN